MKLDKEKIARFGNIELLAKNVVEGFITGMHKSPFHGFSVEFAEHRLYNKGEPTRHIDWKLFARTDKLFVKRYEEETNLRCQLVLDTSSSMNFPLDKQSLSKKEFAVYAAASLMQLLKKQRDAVGLTFFNDEIKLNTPEKSSEKHHRFLYSQLESILSFSDNQSQSNIVNSLHYLAEKSHRRSLIVIFSDMMESGENQEIFSALQHLRHNKHDVILFHVMDKQKELALNFENRPYVFVDMETGEEMKLNPIQIKELYQEKMITYQNSLKLKCGQYLIDYVQADINEGLFPILSSYLIKRGKMI